jgi:hypothetical protein
MDAFSAQHLPWLYDAWRKMGAFIVYHLHYILEWYISASAIFRKSFKFFGNSNRVRVYYMTAGVVPDGRCDYRELLGVAFPAGYVDEFKDNVISRVLGEGKLLEETNDDGQAVTGKVHCEAALMALAATRQTGQQLGLDENKLQVIKASLFFSAHHH